MFQENPIRLAGMWRRLTTRFLLLLLLACASTAVADDISESLEVRQRRLADEYERLENVLLRMAELTAATDPRRAALLKKTVAESKQRLIDVQFERIAGLLAKEQLARAEEDQQNVVQDLRVLLKLLLSENRAKRIESEKARIRAYLKQLNQIINRQKSVQGRTASPSDSDPLAEEQARLAKDTGGLADEIRNNEEAGDARSEDPKGDSSDKQNPARERIEAARERMHEAEQQLRQAEREGAIERQEEAIRELEKAKAELEAILRQLREEEIEQVLTVLEARFAKMLQMQREVYLGTQRLDKAAEDGLSHDQEIEAGRLSSQETEIVLEADKALALLREDGTSAAFPEALSQARDDMRQVVYRLARAKVGRITQAVEEDVIAALEEMLAALKQALEDAEQRRDQQRNQPPGQPQDPSLVDMLAELRMIRALQLRVNTRTERYSKLIGGPQADQGDLLDALKRLAEHQQRIYRITRDLELGKNQ